MRPLTTDADRAAAAALVEDRARALAERGITVPHHHVAAFRDACSEAAGLYEDTAEGEEILLACLLLHRTPTPCPGEDTNGPSLGTSLLYTAPGLMDRLGWLITLWISDFAARAGATRVSAEVPSQHEGQDTGRRLLNHLSTIGWLVTGTGISRNGERVTRLQLGAQDREGLAALIHCTVDTTMPEGASR
ncbi:hypothetical protein ACFQ9Q_06240 [Streptomyces virginiae]|uniref:hypothetical protein n=1 Tax=Streptomyces virginiae TaxID=1961 RepID=UPI003692D56F